MDPERECDARNTTDEVYKNKTRDNKKGERRVKTQHPELLPNLRLAPIFLSSVASKPGAAFNSSIALS